MNSVELREAFIVADWTQRAVSAHTNLYEKLEENAVSNGSHWENEGL